MINPWKGADGVELALLVALAIVIGALSYLLILAS